MNYGFFLLALGVVVIIITLGIVMLASTENKIEKKDKNILGWILLGFSWPLIRGFSRPTGLSRNEKFAWIVFIILGLVGLMFLLGTWWMPGA